MCFYTKITTAESPLRYVEDEDVILATWPLAYCGLIYIINPKKDIKSSISNVFCISDTLAIFLRGLVDGEGDRPRLIRRTVIRLEPSSSASSSSESSSSESSGQKHIIIMIIIIDIIASTYVFIAIGTPSWSSPMQCEHILYSSQKVWRDNRYWRMYSREIALRNPGNIFWFILCFVQKKERLPSPIKNLHFFSV